MTERELTEKIVEHIGGKENVSKATHCVTRLRLYINDESKFDKEKIVNELGLQVVVAGGQHQIIIGPGKVDRIYDMFIELTGIQSGGLVDADEDENIADKGKKFKEKQNLLNTFIELLASIFQPMLGLLAGAGMIKGMTALLVALNLVNADTSTYAILNSIGESFFIGLPVFVGYYSMKRFGGTPMLGATIGLILISPAITAYGQGEVLYTLFEGTPFQAGVQADLFGLPIIVGFIGYQYAVVPVIFISWIAAKFEKIMKKITPDAVSLFFVPFVTILVASILGLIIVGPITAILTSILNNVFQYLLTAFPVISGLLLGGAWQILVMFGLHWAIVPLSFLQLAEFGAGNVDKLNVLASVYGVSFATIGSVLAVMIVERSKTTNAIALPAFITGIFGITEPAIYGVVLPKKIPFYTACVGGAVSGGFLAMFNNGAYSTGGLGVLKLPTFINPEIEGFLGQTDLWIGIIGAIIGFVVAFILTLMLYKDPKKIH